VRTCGVWVQGQLCHVFCAIRAVTRSMDSARLRVAIVGGGVTGATAASCLASELKALCDVTLFDQGRGLGGRCSHRKIRVKDGVRLPADADEASFAWDHGCQFFRADTAEFRENLLKPWLQQGLASKWAGRFGCVGEGCPDFFGVGPTAQDVYCGTGGMHSIVCGAISAAVETAKEAGGVVDVQVGVRVGGLECVEYEGMTKWQLHGVSGSLAYHDSKHNNEEEVMAARAANILGTFDFVILTDASAAMDGWHRASAGLPRDFIDSVAKRVRDRVRVALFTAMVVFTKPVPTDLDAITFKDPTIWFAARTASKPGASRRALAGECWTLVSTAHYATNEIQRVPMQDPDTGVFIPQDPEYLNTPARDLIMAFEAALKVEAPLSVSYMTAQRWGSAMPAPVHLAGYDHNGHSEASREILGIWYDSSQDLRLVPESTMAPGDGGADFLHDPQSQLLYAGDFCSLGPPGVESAALSGLHAAKWVAQEVSLAKRDGRKTS